MVQQAPTQIALVLMIVLGIPVLIGWLALLAQCANAPFKSDGDKIAWVLILLFLGPIGAGLYLTAGRSRQAPAKAKEKWMV